MEEDKLAVRENPNDLMIVEVKRITEELIRLRDKAHLLTPLARTNFSEMLPGYRGSLRVTTISSNPEEKEVYRVPGTEGQLALTKVALQRLEQLAGVQWVSSRVYVDPAEPLVAKGEAEGKVQDLDGSWRNAKAERVVDLRENSPEIQSMRTAAKRDGKSPDARIAQARVNIAQLAETKAKNRVRREILGLQSTFTAKDLEKPFVILKLVPRIDMTDPFVRKLITMQQLGITSELYDQAAKAIDIPAVAVEIEGAEEAPSEPPDKSPAEPPAQQPQAVESPPQQATAAPSPVQETGYSRASMIARVKELYSRKMNRPRDPSRPPLESLSDNELQQIEIYLDGQKDHRDYKPPQI